MKVASFLVLWENRCLRGDRHLTSAPNLGRILEGVVLHISVEIRYLWQNT
jgi:hypothetical protein